MYYIERGEAINEFAIRSSFYDAEWGNKRFTPDDVKEILQSIPAADVRPVVRGKWEKQDANLVWNDVGLYAAAYKCNRCGELNIAETNFCPNCGSDMRDSNDGI